MSQISAPATQRLDTETMPRSWLALGFLGIPVFLGSLDLTVVSAFLPTLLNELGLTLDGAGLADVSWVLTSYLLAYSVSLFAMGRVSDFIGRRATLAICLVLYVVGSLLVVFFANTASVLGALYDITGLEFTTQQTGVHAIILGRMTAAFGAGAITSIAIALVGDMFPSERRAIPLGIVMALDTVGWLIGAAWGGLVVQFLPWQAIFLINMPLVLLALAIIWVVLRDVPRQQADGRFDVVGFLLLSVMLASLNIGLVTINSTETGLDLSTTLPAVGLAFVLGGVFLLVQLRSASPLISPAILKSPGIAGGTLINLLLGYCMFIPLVSIPLLINVRGLNELGFAAAIEPILAEVLKDASFDTGVLMAAFTVPLALASVVGGWLSNRIGAFYTILLGLMLAAVGYGLNGLLLNLGMTNLQIGLMMSVTGTGIGLASTPILLTTLASVSNQQRGMASALLLGVRMVGMTIATSTVSIFGAQRIVDLVESVERGRFVLELVRPEDYVTVFAITYINAAGQTIGEMALMGLIGCFVALVVTLTIWRKGKPSS